MKKFRRPIRNYFLSKIVGMFLVGTLHAAVAQQPSPKVIQFAHAIAQAEGYSLKGSIPQRCNNPGDLKGTKFAGQVGVCKGGHARFRTSAAGWAALYGQVEKILDGTSTKYTNRATFKDVAKTYAQNYRPWLKIVTDLLDAEPQDSVTDWTNKNRETYLAEDFDLNFDLERWDYETK
jgi:hypothetical protein